MYSLKLDKRDFDAAAKLIVVCTNAQETQEKQNAHVEIMYSLVHADGGEKISFEQAAEILNLFGSAAYEEANGNDLSGQLEEEPMLLTEVGMKILNQIREQDPQIMEKLKTWYDYKNLQ